MIRHTASHNATLPQRVAWEDLRPSERAQLSETHLVACPGAPDVKATTGTECVTCPHSGGLVRYANTGNAAKDLRGACQFPTARTLRAFGAGFVVSCPLAQNFHAKARRFDLISADACASCEFAGMANEETQECSAPKGAQFQPVFLRPFSMGE